MLELFQAFQPGLSPSLRERALPVSTPVAARPTAAARSAPVAPSSRGDRVQAALELIERIELFVKAQRPALTLSLQFGPVAKVEVERTGDGVIALKLHGRNGLPPPEEVGLIREAVRERGLRLSSLSVA